MRIAVDASSEVGNRCARVLLGERSVDFLGIVGASVRSRRRSGPVADLTGFDALISDGTTDVHSLLGRASVAGIPIVLWGDEPGIGGGSVHTPIVHGANVATALTAALAAHPAATTEDADLVRVAWTEPGKERTSGTPITFPEPIGNQWAKKRTSGTFVATVDDEWGAAVVDIDGPAGRRIVGVSDHAAYMEAMVLAATGLVAATETLEPTVVSAAALGDRILTRLGDVELEIAVWRSTINA